MSIFRVLVVGCGNFGSWLAAGLLASGRFQVGISDPNIDNKCLVLKRAYTIRSLSYIRSNFLGHFSSADAVTFSPDVVIVATDSRSRLNAVRVSAQLFNPKVWLIEKVLASSMQQLDEMGELLQGKNAYVHHSRRNQPLWNIARLILANQPHITAIKQTLNAWELASNSFHYADLITYLFGTTVLDAKAVVLPKDWRQSTVRKDCDEFEGKVTIRYSNNILHSIDKTCQSGSSILDFYGPSGQLILSVNEQAGIITDSRDSRLAHCQLMNSSEIISTMITDLLQDRSVLPTIKEAIDLHKLLLESYLQAWSLSSPTSGFKRLQIS